VRIVGGSITERTLFGPGDSLIVDGGRDQGVRAGDEFYVRRVEKVRAGFDAEHLNVFTAGLVRIVESRADDAVATVTLACDGIMAGDHLERFQPAVVPAAVDNTSPDYGRVARVVLGTGRREMGAAGDFMILDRGSDHGLRAGQAVTIFRSMTPAAALGAPATIGTARVQAVQSGTATIRIDRSVDAVYVGDLVAIHR
jgi:hypothetical protein